MLCVCSAAISRRNHELQKPLLTPLCCAVPHPCTAAVPRGNTQVPGVPAGCHGPRAAHRADGSAGRMLTAAFPAIATNVQALSVCCAACAAHTCAAQASDCLCSSAMLCRVRRWERRASRRFFPTLHNLYWSGTRRRSKISGGQYRQADADRGMLGQHAASAWQQGSACCVAAARCMQAPVACMCWSSLRGYWS